MKHINLTAISAIFVLTLNAAQAQGLVDGFFSQKGNISLTASYTFSTYDEFYAGEELTGPAPAHNEIDQNVYSLYGKYGVFNDLTLITNFSYISAKGEGAADPFNGETEVSDLQDISIFAKYRPYSIEISNAKLDVISALGVNIATGYEPTGVLSIGNGAFTTDVHLGAHLQSKKGFFTTLLGGYSLRTKADNNYGLSNGNDFDVPNAFLFMGKIGYAASKFYLETWLDHQSSTEGIDIGDPSFSGQLPETKVNYTRMGFTGYVPITSLVGISAGFGTVIDGRNVGDANYYSGGITFNID